MNPTLYHVNYLSAQDNKIYQCSGLLSRNPEVHMFEFTLDQFILKDLLQNSVKYDRAQNIYFVSAIGNPDILLAVQNGTLIKVPQDLQERFAA